VGSDHARNLAADVLPHIAAVLERLNELPDA
jgi:hypothetical protein